MAARYVPKTLAKTISYIAFTGASEFGLFWDEDGTMPWKELHWALQQDASLRFVRESHLRELAYLGEQLPFVMAGSLLRLREDIAVPVYPLVDSIPARLYFACRRKQYGFVQQHGLAPSGRSYLPLAANRELALHIAQRRDPQPILIEILAPEAEAKGVLFRQAGPELYLAMALASEYLLLPPLREKQLAASGNKKKQEKKPAKVEQSWRTPGSFFMDVQQLQESSSAQQQTGQEGWKKGRKGGDWKRQSRKDRNKRSV